MSPYSAPAGLAPESPSAARSLEQEETAFLKRELASLFAGQGPLVEAFLEVEPGAGQEALYTGAARFVLERARDVSACLKECLDALALGAGLPQDAKAAGSAGEAREAPADLADAQAPSAAEAEGEAGPAGSCGAEAAEPGEGADAPEAAETAEAPEAAEAAGTPSAAPDAAPLQEESAPASGVREEAGSEAGLQDAPGAASAAPDAARKADGAEAKGAPFDWRADCQAILEGRFDADRGRLLDLLERAMACADREGADPAAKRLVEAASDHFTALLARGAAGAGEAPRPQPEAEPKKAPESGAATFTVTPAGTCASGGVDIPVVHAGAGGGEVPAAEPEDETPFEELPPCIQELVRLAEGRLDTGDAQADVRSLSQRFRQLREEAIAAGGPGRWERYFKRASAHIAKILNRVHGEGGFARQDAGQAGGDSPRYMREVDAVARGDYDSRVDDIYAILSNAILEARRDGREEEFQERLEAASEHLNRLLSSRCVHAGRPAGSDPSESETADELRQDIFRGETPDEDFVAETAGASAGAGQDAAKPAPRAGAARPARPSPAPSAPERSAPERPASERPSGQAGGGKAGSGAPEAQGQRRQIPHGRHAGAARGVHKVRREPSWQACVQAVKDIGQGRFDTDPQRALDLLREAASRLEQEGLAEHFEPEIRRAARRLALLMRQEPEGAPAGWEGQDFRQDPRLASRFGQRPEPRRVLPSYMQGVEDINQGRFDDDPGTMLEILDYAIRAASRQGRLEEFRPRLEQASRRASAVLERRSGDLFGGRFF